MSRADDDTVIRRIRPGEVEAYRDFRLRALADAPDAFSDTYAAAVARPASAWTERVAESSAGVTSVMMVAADPATGAWLGMTGCFFEDDPTRANVVSVWVAPEARRRGLARRLLEAASTWARSRGAGRLLLWVTESNAEARALYLGAGFIPTGRRGHHPGRPELPEIEMSRDV
jgi:GNAT superfamily N-acetyltransferase